MAGKEGRSVPVYDSIRAPSPFWEELVEAWRYRDLIVQLVRRDVITRYKRSVLGIAWTMLNPLGMMIVLTVAFSQVFHTVRAYPAYLLIGLVVWNFFAQTTVSAMRQLLWGAGLLHRIYIPKTTLVLSAVGTGLVHFGLALVPLTALLLILGVPLRPPVLCLPVALCLLTAFTLGVALLLSTLAAFFPDVTEMYEIALLAWMYLTPIIYPEEIIPATYRFWVLNLNPMYHLLKLFRQPLYHGLWPTPECLAVATGVALTVLCIGWWAFTRKAHELAYRI
jgi:ABC-type polysaccharide/polyol phosphate export permease